MLSAFRALFHRRSPSPPVSPDLPARRLATEQGSEFFTWFHLEPDGEPVVQDVAIRHRFRPSGDAFRGLVALDVMADAADGMLSASLCLDRSFVSGPQDAFARDIARSFLDWILEDEARTRAAPLIADIGNLAAADAAVNAAAPAPEPPPRTGDAYAVFTGDGDVAALALGAARLTLANAGGRLVIEAVLRE